MDELIDQLRLITAAIEAQNDFNERWMVLQVQWHNEAELRSQEHMDFERQVFAFQQECHEEAERLNEQRYQEQSARENKIAMAYIDHATRQDREP